SSLRPREICAATECCGRTSAEVAHGLIETARTQISVSAESAPQRLISVRDRPRALRIADGRKSRESASSCVAVFVGARGAQKSTKVRKPERPQEVARV